MGDFETPSARARRERLERLWPVQKPRRKTTRRVPKPVEPVPDEADVLDPTVEPDDAQTAFETSAD